MHQQDYSSHNTELLEKLSKQFEAERADWKEKVANLNKKMKNIMSVSELMTEVYTERQLCLEYYHYLVSKLVEVNREYRRRYAERHDFWSYKSNIRYPNETSKNNKIQVELADLLQKRELIENHSKYILRTVETIDNIIYAIPRRIEIEQIARGK